MEISENVVADISRGGVILWVEIFGGRDAFKKNALLVVKAMPSPRPTRTRTN